MRPRTRPGWRPRHPRHFGLRASHVPTRGSDTARRNVERRPYLPRGMRVERLRRSSSLFLLSRKSLEYSVRSWARSHLINLARESGSRRGVASQENSRCIARSGQRAGGEPGRGPREGLARHPRAPTAETTGGTFDRRNTGVSQDQGRQSTPCC